MKAAELRGDYSRVGPDYVVEQDWGSYSADEHALYRRLFAILREQGYRTMVAVIGLPNPKSVALHEALGFAHAGTLRNVGYKFVAQPVTATARRGR